jgi:GT2 family glycosyltransferase
MKPKVSLAIATLNEGEQLRATIQCVLAAETVPDEIVVYDDAGVVPANIRGMDRRVTLIRGMSRIGSGPAKHRAVEECSGSLVIVMDGHCRPANDWLGPIIDEHRRHPWAVMCTVCVGIESASFRAGAFRGMGGKLELGSAGFWEVKWNEPRPGVHSYAVPSVVGGCYAMPRRVLDRIGGYAPGYFGYGVEEEYLSLRTWLTGGECRIVPRSVVGHFFNRPLNRKTIGPETGGVWEQQFNRHVAAMVCFGHGVYEKAYKPTLDKHWPAQALQDKLRADTKKISDIHRAVQKNRTLKDADLQDWCGVSHPHGV